MAANSAAPSIATVVLISSPRIAPAAVVGPALAGSFGSLEVESVWHVKELL
jgi:hypothetical protein